MLVVSAILGNIYSDGRLSETWRRKDADGKTEHLSISRSDLEKTRMRRRTDRGTDIGIVLERGSHLHHGDVLDVKGKLVVVEQLPEKVITIMLDNANTRQAVDKAAMVGHVIGNRHRPVSVGGGRISFPIQDESELAVFERLLPTGVRLKVTTEIFVPSGDSHHHE